MDGQIIVSRLSERLASQSRQDPFQQTQQEPIMDNYEKVGYTCLAIVAICYLIAMIYGVIAAFPFGLLVGLVLLGVGVLLVKVLKERLTSTEDDYYDQNVEK